VSFASVRKFFFVSLMFAALAVNARAQSADSGKNFTPVPNQGQPLTGKRPFQQRTLTVILKLAGDPVAVARGRAPRKRLSAASEQSIVRARRTQQDALTPLIQAHGVKILAKLQYAINGIKVSGTADQIAKLAELPGVVAVKPVRIYTLDNATSVPFLGTPTVWQGPPALHGEHIRVAVIDTGIDYTHANFGGPGTVAAFNTAFTASTSAADPTMFGPNAPKVKGGTDLVGDNYDASTPAKSTPVPDPNPLDCAGHGSHVAGTVAGFGVAANGTRYTGPYDSTTPSNSFVIGPGVAPLADLYAVRVFGCSGSTNVVTEAIDWAVANNMNVINMSLGSSFGSEDSADAEAATNAESAGVIVVASAGNSGNIPYITGSPAAGDKAISVAAMDSHASFPGVNVALSGGSTIVTQNSNNASLTDGTSLPIKVLRNADQSISLGCNDSEYASVAGYLVVTMRGNCDRIQRAKFGQAHGAAAVAMINNSAGYPPVEGPIPGVSIPFLGVLQNDGPTLAAATAGTLTNNSGLANPTFRNFASFTSSGPRISDSNLKPDITGPGVSIFSTANGTGNQGTLLSGTSMAAPHVSGVAALALQAHPAWTPDDVRLAILNSADPTQLTGFTPRLGGAGLVQPVGATRTSVVARADDDAGSLSFGLAEFSQDYQATHNLTVSNNGSQTSNFNVSAASSAGSSQHSATIESFLTVAPGQTAILHLTLSVPAATAGNSSAFREVAGLVTLTPASPSDNSGVSMNIPYYLVPRARSLVSTTLTSSFGTGNPSTTAQVSNASAVVNGTANFFAWGLSGQNSALGAVGLRAVGVQSFDSTSGKELVFAVNSFAPWTYHGGTLEFEILLDINGDGTPDYAIFSDDLGLFNSGVASGQIAAIGENLATKTFFADFFANAPDNGSTILLPVLAAHVGVNTGNPRFSYSAESFDALGNSDVIAGPAKFNAFQNAITTAAFVSLPPGSSASVPLSIDTTEWANTPALGEMIASLDNSSGVEQAQLLQVSTAPAISKTTTTLNSSLNPSTYGQAVTFTANVSSTAGTPTGTVTFLDDGTTQLGTASLDSSGNASLTTSLLTADGHSITVSYAGNTSFAASLSGALSQTVKQAASTTAVASNANPSTYAQSVTFTATVASSSGTPTGRVTFTDGTTTLATGILNSTGHATFTTATLTVGTHTIRAAYGGDVNFNSSTGTVSQAVHKASSGTALVSSPNPSVQGKAVKFTATVSPQFTGLPTGKVTFRNGTLILATKALSAGVAIFSTSTLAVGSSNISATYAGDANFTGSASNTVVQVVQAAVSTVLTSSGSPSTYKQAVTFTATLSSTSGPPPNGETVTFMDGSAVLGTGTLSSGVATFTTTSPLKVGSHSIKSVYAGDATFAASTSAALTQTVTKAVTTTALNSSPNPSSSGQVVTVTATVTSGAGTPTGSVTFTSDGAPIGSKALSGGVATLTTSALAVGSHSLTATYKGSTNFATSTSQPLTQTVQ
jgi:minor extracellular serine protease Vpr